MTLPLTNEQKSELEQLIDAHGLERVIYALSEICNEKAEHVSVNWQDRALAKLWTRAARALDKASVPARELP